MGDFVDTASYAGTVKEIQIFYTIMVTPDNKTIIIPNGSLAKSSLTNFSTMPQRSVDFSFGIGYADDFEKAKGIISSIIEANERIHEDPTPFLRVGELADNSVYINMRVLG